MALRRGRMGFEPIRMYDEPTPKAVASNIIFLAAWLAGTTGYFLSILATTIAHCVRWLSIESESNPPSLADLTLRTPHRLRRPAPIVTRPLLPRENAERHVSFSFESWAGRGLQQPLPPSENMTCAAASFSSEESTLCSSPLSDLGDLPPLKNLPPLLLDPQVPEQIQAKRRPMTVNFPIKARNPFKFRRTSMSSSPSPNPAIGEILLACPLIDRHPTSLVDPGSGKLSLIKRLNMKGRRASGANTVIGSPSSAPTSPRLPPSSFRTPADTSKRSASVDIPTQTSGSPMFASPSLHQSSPRRNLFNSFTRRPRTQSLSAAPARTQPYGPPYNCPLPIPQPRRSSGTRRPTATTSTPAPAT